MSLFNQPIDATFNYLPRDGIVNYYGPIVSVTEAKQYFNALNNNIPWAQDQIFIYGRHITTVRRVAWFGDIPFAYSYSGNTRNALTWTSELLEIKALIEKQSQQRFNSCLLNLYPDGDTGMAWHSDDEKTLVQEAAIASVSFGAPRKFVFKHKQDAKLQVPVILENGSLLLMQGSTQTHWLHSISKTKKITTPRINLTFRSMKVNENS